MNLFHKRKPEPEPDPNPPLCHFTVAYWCELPEGHDPPCVHSGGNGNAYVEWFVDDNGVTQTTMYQKGVEYPR